VGGYWEPGYRYRRRIQVYIPGSPIASGSPYSVPVKFPFESIGNLLGENNNDVYFTDLDGRPLNAFWEGEFSYEDLSPSLWVRVDSLPTSFYMFYGNPYQTSFNQSLETFPICAEFKSEDELAQFIISEGYISGGKLILKPEGTIFRGEISSEIRVAPPGGFHLSVAARWPQGWESKINVNYLLSYRLGVIGTTSYLSGNWLPGHILSLRDLSTDTAVGFHFSEEDLKNKPTIHDFFIFQEDIGSQTKANWHSGCYCADHRELPKARLFPSMNAMRPLDSFLIRYMPSYTTMNAEVYYLFMREFYDPEPLVVIEDEESELEEEVEPYGPIHYYLKLHDDFEIADQSGKLADQEVEDELDLESRVILRGKQHFSQTIRDEATLREEIEKGAERGYDLAFSMNESIEAIADKRMGDDFDLGVEFSPSPSKLAEDPMLLVESISLKHGNENYALLRDAFALSEKSERSPTYDRSSVGDALTLNENVDLLICKALSDELRFNLLGSIQVAGTPYMEMHETYKLDERPILLYLRGGARLTKRRPRGSFLKAPRRTLVDPR